MVTLTRAFSRTNHTAVHLVALAIGIAMLLVAVWQSSEPAQAAAARPPEIIEVAADLPDSSVELVGYLVLPSELYRDVDPPLVVLLHERGSSHKVWQGFWTSLYTKGVAVLAIDLRGHGLSIYDLKRQRNRSPNVFYEGEFLKFPDDVKFLVDTCIALHSDKIDESQIAVVGAGVGANTALLYALQEPRVSYLAMVSPGLDRRGLEIAGAMAQIEGVDIFLAASEQDHYSYISVDLLTDFFKDKVDYEIYQTFHHGNRLITSTAELKHRLLVDILKRLRPDIELLE